MSQIIASCPHEKRPGTTVCLLCRRDSRRAAIVRRRRIALRTVLIAAGVAAAGASVWGVVDAVVGFRPDAVRRYVAALALEVRDAAQRGEDAPSGESETLTMVSQGATVEHARMVQPVALVSPALAPTPLAAIPARPATPPMIPIVAQGATKLKDSVIAVRRGDSVVVHFDTPLGRTRRPEKFEQIVRATLPAIYGPMADSVLDRIPVGNLARTGDLLTDLPARGLRFSLGAGWALALWPETRPGQDGPLVVMYRALVTKPQ